MAAEAVGALKREGRMNETEVVGLVQIPPVLRAGRAGEAVGKAVGSAMLLRGSVWHLHADGSERSERKMWTNQPRTTPLTAESLRRKNSHMLCQEGGERTAIVMR